MSIINTTIAKNPLNWLTVWSMAFIALYVAHLLANWVNGNHPGQRADGTEGIAGPGTDVPVMS